MIALFQELRRLGVRLTPYPDGTLRHTGTLPPALVVALRQHTQELLDLVEAFEERAAIVEYDGGLPRAEAERLAWACMQGIGDEGQTVQTAEVAC